MTIKTYNKAQLFNQNKNLTVLSMNWFVTIHFITYKTQTVKTETVWYTHTLSQMNT